MSLLGDVIRRERRAAGMTQTDLGNVIGVGKPSMSDFEKGYRPVTLDRLFQIANQFPNVDTAEWLILALRDQWGDATVDLIEKYIISVHEKTRDSE